MDFKSGNSDSAFFSGDADDAKEKAAVVVGAALAQMRCDCRK